MDTSYAAYKEKQKIKHLFRNYMLKRRSISLSAAAAAARQRSVIKDAHCLLKFARSQGSAINGCLITMKSVMQM
jgi:hypothetical protein